MELERLDVHLVRRGLARSRGQAHDLIAAGAVTLDGGRALKASTPVSVEAVVTVDEADAQWVGRAALKMLGAFEAFGPEGTHRPDGVAPLTAQGRRCLDIGACTGGFTQVLLHHGAAQVIALDVGHDQLAPQIAADPRVLERSGTSVRGLAAADLGGEVDLIVGDLSFISLRLVIAEIAGLLASGGEAVLLVKPQFEVGRSRLTKTGLVRSARDRRDAVQAVLTEAEAHGLLAVGVVSSSIRGGEGNREYLLRLAPSEAVGPAWQARRITDAVTRSVAEIAEEGR